MAKTATMIAAVGLVVTTACNSLPREPDEGTELPELGGAPDPVEKRKRPLPPESARPDSGPQREEPRVLREWSGDVDLKAARKLTPYGAVDNQADWEQTWKTLRPGEPVPTVDFNRDLVLVHVVGDPNSASISSMTLKPDGNLVVRYMTTAMMYHGDVTTTSYLLTRISGRGVRFVNGFSPGATSATPAGSPDKAAPFPMFDSNRTSHGAR